MDGKSPHSTSSPTGAAALLLLRKLKPNKLETIVKQSKGTADHLMPLGDWLTVPFTPGQFNDHSLDHWSNKQELLLLKGIFSVPPFLHAYKHLYKSVCTSISQSDYPSVHPSSEFHLKSLYNISQSFLYIQHPHHHQYNHYHHHHYHCCFYRNLFVCIFVFLILTKQVLSFFISFFFSVTHLMPLGDWLTVPFTLGQFN